MPETKVLIPLDGSPTSEAALGSIEVLKKLGSLRVRLLSIVEAPEGLSSVAENEHLQRESALLTSYLERLAERLKSEGLEIETELLAGDPIELISQQASSFEPDMLVIGTHGRSGLTRWRLGSVADAVINARLSNTLVVGPHARFMDSVRALLVSLDGLAFAEEALPVATSLATAFNATLHLVRAVPIPMATADVYDITEPYDQTLLDSMKDSATVYLERMRSGLDFPGSIVTETSIGSPAEVLSDYIAAKKIDLLVMASHGRRGVLRTTLGSVTGRMVGGPVPVLVVQTGG